MSKHMRSRSEEHGAVAVIVSICTVMLFIVAAMVVDLGLARDVRRQSQIAADASALAAANRLFPDSNVCATVNPWGTKTPPCFVDSVAEAKSYATTNYGVTAADWSSCPTSSRPAGYVSVPGDTPCISFDTPIALASKPTKVYVAMPARTIRTGLGAVAGVKQINISTKARATVATSKKRTCGLCFLGPVDGGNADFTVEGGAIHVNGTTSDCTSSTNAAIDVGPQSKWTASSITVCGTWSTSPTFAPTPFITSHIDDPYASMVLPPTTWPSPFQSNRTDPCKSVANGGGPGTYDSPVEIPNSDCVLLPGLYVITKKWDMKNNSFLKDLGAGVTLYVRSGGYLDFKNGAVALSPMTTGPFAGFTIVYDRSNTNMLSLQGNGATSLAGRVYVPSSLLDFNGNSCFGFSGGPIVAKGVNKANGNTACVTVKNAADVELPTPPSDVSLDQ